MATLTRYSDSTPTVVAGSWSTTGNLTGDDGLFATTSPAKNGTSTLDCVGFDFSSIPNGSTINSVTIEAGGFVSTTASVDTIGIQAFDGATAIGTEGTSTTWTTSDGNVVTAGGTAPTLAQLKSANFKVRIRASRGNSNTAFTASFDYVRVTVDYTPPATVVSVGQASESDSAFSVARSKLRSVGQAIESDSAFVVTARRSKLVSVGQAGETSSATSVARSKLRSVALVVETDTAALAGTTKRRSITTAVEADLAFVVARSKLVSVGLAGETSSATTITRRKLRSVGQTGETSSATSVARSKLRSVALVVETDTATAIARAARTITVGQAIETSNATTITRRKLVDVALVVEIDTAGSIALSRIVESFDAAGGSSSIDVVLATTNRYYGDVTNSGSSASSSASENDASNSIERLADSATRASVFERG